MGKQISANFVKARTQIEHNKVIKHNLFTPTALRSLLRLGGFNRNLTVGVFSLKNSDVKRHNLISKT